MKKRSGIALFIAALALSASLQAAEVAGVRVDDRLTANGRELVLNGAGLRTKLFFKVYVAALYVPQKSGTAASVLESIDPARINLRLMRDLDAETLHSALLDGLLPNLQEGEQASLQPFLDQLGALMRRINKISTGDTVTLDFTPEGLAVSLNGDARGTVAGGRNARRLLSIWLGSHPVDEKLKKALLGS
ncbi:MAG TPA: chalcone isomerase family protein [Rhodocyclaceae bacterium]|jgi:long-chain acyl-CoA synthetase